MEDAYFDGEKYYPIIHTYYGDDEYADRKSIVINKEDTFCVVMIEDGKIKEERMLNGYSEVYAEDCAENFVIGIISWQK